ncbi:MAG: alpha/beta fold hydrolase [Pseudomonadota bacterium]
MRHIPLLVAALTASSAIADVDQRVANNGNLIMEDIPEIPAEIVDGINRYQQVRSAAFRDWTADGTGIYVSTRFGDTSQLHRVDMPGGARRQLTFFDEPIGGVTRKPDSDTMVITMDAGGSEFDQIFVMEPATGTVTMVSDGESRNGAVLWAPNGSRIAYQSTRRNGRSNDIWVMDPSVPEGARTALESPDGSWWGPADFSADGSMLLVQQYVSVNDSRVHLLDVESGESQLIAGGGDTPSANLAGEMLPDGSGYYLLTDESGEFRQLVFRSIDGDREIPVSEGIPWNVGNLAVSDDGRRAAFTVNANGYSELYLLDPTTQQHSRVEDLPGGTVGGLSFSPDGTRLAMTVSTPRTPGDVFVLSLGRGALDAGTVTRWTYSEVGGLDTDQFVEPELISYTSFDDREIPAFVYRPEGDGPFPVVVSIHGGPEAQYRPGFRSIVQYWVRELGVAVIAPNVRGSNGYGKSYLKLDNGFLREDSVKDIGALLDWIATRDDLDADRVGVIGGSYGGYMVLASAVHYSDRLRGAVDIVGISSFVTFLENTQDYRRDLRRVEYGDERDPAMRAHLEKISPLNNVEKIKVPMLVVQGQNDPRVPVTEAEQIVAALRDGKQSVWYMNALNEGHGYARKENRDIYTQAVALFFREHLLQ